MPEYLSPGVYVEEIDAGPKPIQGVGTSTTGAVGVTVRGPTSGKPELVTSFADFQRKFGGFLPDPDALTLNTWAGNPAEGGRWWTFPLAVKGYFDNGGQRLYVKRVFSSTAVASSVTLGHGLVSEVTRAAAVGSTTVRLRHLFGITEGTTLTFFTGSGEPIDGGAAYQVAAYDAATGQVTLDNPLGAGLGASGDIAEIAARDTNTSTLVFSARASGAWGDDLSVRVRPVLANTFTVQPNPTSGPLQSTTLAADASPAADPSTDPGQIDVNEAEGFETYSSEPANPTDPVPEPLWLRIGGAEYRVGAIAAPGGAPATVTFHVDTPLTTELTEGTTVTRLRSAALAQPNRLQLSGGSRLYVDAIVELDTGTAKQLVAVTAVDGDTVTFNPAPAGPHFDGHKARLVEAEVSILYEPEGGDPVDETFGPVRLIDDGSASTLLRQVNERSDLVEVEAGADLNATNLTRFPTAESGGWAEAGDGDDGHLGLSVDDFMGLTGDGERKGVDALELVDEVAICVAPGMWSQTVRNALIQHCEILKDRFAIVDPADGLDIEDIREFRAPIDTLYAALYYPWLRLRDPAAGREVVAPPSGHMAGIYARVDVERGVHKAPANEVVRGINGFERDVTKREQDLLNPQGINAFRFFPGRGNRVWGARTVSSDSAWRYINVRRLFIFVEESIDESTQWVVFEPNAEELWARVRASVTNFLTTVWRSGALEGTTAEEAFFVACDRTTMTQDDIDNGRLICVIGIAPVKPAEFVIFRIQQKTREAEA